MFSKSASSFFFAFSFFFEMLFGSGNPLRILVFFNWFEMSDIASTVVVPSPAEFKVLELDSSRLEIISLDFLAISEMKNMCTYKINNIDGLLYSAELSKHSTIG